MTPDEIRAAYPKAPRRKRPRQIRYIRVPGRVARRLKKIHRLSDRAMSARGYPRPDRPANWSKMPRQQKKDWIRDLKLAGAW